MTLKILIWDRIVRIGHWLLAGSFILAYVSAESERWRLVHVVSGCIVFASVIMRVVWGLMGSKHAKFSSFIKAPQHAFQYLKSLRTSQPLHYTGHNPAGGWAVLGLLGLSLLASVTGWLTYNNIGSTKLGEWHELVSELTMLLVALHVFAVVASSYLHRENLLKAMFTGMRQGIVRERIKETHWLGVFVYFLLLASIAYFSYRTTK